MENEYQDKRCPCMVCIVRNNCTDYFRTFHFYRKLILAETDLFMSEQIIAFDPDPNNQRMMSDMEREIKVAYSVAPGLEARKIYLRVKRNLRFLVGRFDKILENSRKANRGASLIGSIVQDTSKAHVGFMRQVARQKKKEKINVNTLPRN